MAKKAEANSTAPMITVSPPEVIPPAQFKHSDPVLRRLRLLDQHKTPVNLEAEFRDTAVVGFLFGQSWNGQVKQSHPMYSLVHEFARIHPHRFKCVYIEAGASEEDYRRATQGKVWLSMEFDDGSDMTEDELAGLLAPKRFARGEDYLRPLGHPHFPEDENNAASESGYCQPWSRAYFTEARNIISAPNLQIYHLPTRTWLTGLTGVRMESMRKGRRMETFEKWENGETVDLKFKDYLQALKWTIAIAVLGIGYIIASRRDPSLNIAQLTEWLMGARTTPATV